MEFTCAALLLDADGTLVDSADAVDRAWRDWAREYGVDGDAVLRVCHGRRSEETIAEFVPPELVEAATARLDHLEVTDLRGVLPCAGAAELLASLNGTPWAVVTSGPLPLVTARMGAAGLALPETLITSESVALGKPDPRCYQLGAAALGVPAADCVVIEDAPAGVQAGRAAGASVIAVTTTHRAEALAEADVVVRTLHQVRVRAGRLTVE